MPLTPLFCENCERIGNEMLRKRNILVTKRWVQLDTKRWRRTSLIDEWLLDAHILHHMNIVLGEKTTHL